MLGLELLVASFLWQGTLVVDDFSGDELVGWEIAGTPEYYRGGFGATGLEIVSDPERGRCLAVPAGFSDAGKSEVVFLTKTLPQLVRASDVRSVRFWYRLDGCDSVPFESLRVRLRTSETMFVDLDLYPARPLEVGKWVPVDLPLDLSQGRNVWGWILDTVKWLTFRLDDVDDRNSSFRFLLSGVQIETSLAPAPYTPRVRQRPDDGVLRVLYARHASAGFYRLREAFSAALPKAQVEEVLFKGLHLPLWWRPVTAEDLLRCDLIVFVDVDPFVLTWDQACALADAVASGAHVLWFGGPNTLDASKRPESPLFAVLPVEIREGTVAPKGPLVPSVAEGAKAHPLATCVPLASLGPVRHVNPVEPCESAQVVLRAGDQPLVVTWPFRRGRATVVTTWCDGESSPDFFTGPGAQSWKERLLRWATDTLPETWTHVVSVSNLTPRRGEELLIEALGEGAGAPCRLSVSAEVVDSPESADTPPVLGKVVEQSDGRFHLQLPEGLREGKLRLTAVLERDGEVRDTVALDVPVRPKLMSTIKWTRHKNCFAPGQMAEFTVAVTPAAEDTPPPEVKGWRVRLGLAEPRRPLSLLLGLGEQPLFSGHPLSFQVPNLLPGDYWLCAEVLDANSTVVAAVESPLTVVDALPGLGDFFPIASFLEEGSGGHCMDEGLLRAWVRDAWEHGFNVAAIPGLSGFRSADLTARLYLRGFVETEAQRLGMATMYEYSSFQLMGREAPTKPCVFAPEYPAALQEQLTPLIDICRRVPRLISAKVTDEPVANLKNIDGCEFCRQEFRERYSVDLPPLDALPEDSYLRWALVDFVGHYVQRGYKLGRKLVEETDTTPPSRPGGVATDRPFDLLLTYMSPGLGFGRPLSSQEDALDWSEGCHRVDFDVYPYFYPSSQRIRMLTAWPCFAFMRAVARQHRLPWGFYVEIDERNWPFQQNPKEASSECAWTAVAQGADYLNSFIHRAFATGCDARPERWDHLGRNLRLMRSLGPLLAATSRPSAAVALYFPTAQQAVDDGYALPSYLFAAVQQAFGEGDLLLEEPVARSGRVDYRGGLLLSKVRLLDSRVIGPLANWVKRGGVLALDQWPQTDEQGRPVDLRAALGAPEALAAWQSLSCGRGRILWLPSGFNAAYKEAVEASRNAEACELRGSLRAALGAAGLKPYVSVHDETGQMEAGLRVADGVALITVVNHAAEANHGVVRVRGLSFPLGYAVRAVVDGSGNLRGESITVRREGSSLTFPVALGGRESAIFVLTAARATRLTAGGPSRPVGRGEEALFEISCDAGGGVALLHVSLLAPDGSPITALSGPRALRNGTGEIRWAVPLNAPSGVYRLRVQMPLSGLTSEARIEVSRAH